MGLGGHENNGGHLWLDWGEGSGGLVKLAGRGWEPVQKVVLIKVRGERLVIFLVRICSLFCPPHGAMAKGIVSGARLPGLDLHFPTYKLGKHSAYNVSVPQFPRL